jgi:hypothetical protein
MDKEKIDLLLTHLLAIFICVWLVLISVIIIQAVVEHHNKTLQPKPNPVCRSESGHRVPCTEKHLQWKSESARVVTAT